MQGTVDFTDETVCAAVEGSRPHLQRIAAAFEPHVRLMVAARLSPSPADYVAVDDLVQQVMMAISRNLARLQRRTVGGLKSYVSGIVRHAVSDYLSSRGPAARHRRPEKSLDSTVAGVSCAGPLWQFLSASCVSPRTAAGQLEQTARLMTELGRLKKEHREVITLAFFDQLPTAEIARQLALSRAAASMLLVRAVKSLRQAMGAADESRL